MAHLKHLGKALRLLRTERGLTQTELQARTGIASSQLSRYEGGTEPSLKNLSTVLEALGASFAELEQANRRVAILARRAEGQDEATPEAIPSASLPVPLGESFDGRRAFLVVDLSEQEAEASSLEPYAEVVQTLDRFLGKRSAAPLRAAVGEAAEAKKGA